MHASRPLLMVIHTLFIALCTPLLRVGAAPIATFSRDEARHVSSLGAIEVSLTGYITKLDTTAHQVTVQWQIAICRGGSRGEGLPGRRPATPDLSTPSCILPDAPAKLYFDFLKRPSWAYNPDTLAYNSADGRLVQTAAAMHAETEHLLRNKPKHQLGMFFYPFETYTTDVAIYASYYAGPNDLEASSLKGRTGTRVFDQLEASISIQYIDLHDPTGTFDASIIFVDSLFKSHEQDEGHPQLWRQARCTFKRSLTTRAIVILVIIACWLTTGLAIGITIQAIRGGILMESTTIFPFAAITTISGLRQWGIGAQTSNMLLIDYIATLPQLALLTSVFFGALYAMYRRTESNMPGTTDEEAAYDSPVPTPRAEPHPTIESSGNGLRGRSSPSIPAQTVSAQGPSKSHKDKRKKGQNRRK